MLRPHPRDASSLASLPSPAPSAICLDACCCSRPKLLPPSRRPGASAGRSGKLRLKGRLIQHFPASSPATAATPPPFSPSSPAATRGSGLDLLPKIASYSRSAASLPMARGPRDGPIGCTGRASWASPARKVARSAVPVPSASYEARQGTAQRARRA